MSEFQSGPGGPGSDGQRGFPSDQSNGGGEDRASATQGVRDRAMLELLYATGLRVSLASCEISFWISSSRRPHSSSRSSVSASVQSRQS